MSWGESLCLWEPAPSGRCASTTATKPFLKPFDMSQSIASSLVQHLVTAGVHRVHGVVGDSLNAIVEQIHKDGRIQWIHYRHEEAAAFAAGAEAQLTGKLAVCAGSCGPGNLHLINGLYDAQRSG